MSPPANTAQDDVDAFALFDKDHGPAFVATAALLVTMPTIG